MTDIYATRVKPTNEVTHVDPSKAERWLEANCHNRNLRESVVNSYARDMAAGNWRYTGDPIRFSVSGVLLDGQHRLRAIIKSGVALPMLVVRNLPDEAQAVMDNGAKRTPADALHLDGHHNPVVLAAVAKMALSPTLSHTSRSITSSEIRNKIDTDPRMREACEELAPQFPIEGATKTVVAYCLWRLTGIDEHAALRFFWDLSTLAELPPGSPILALHKRLIAHARTTTEMQTRRTESVAYIFTAWNAWRRGQDRTQIKLSHNASGRLVIPAPK